LALAARGKSRGGLGRPCAGKTLACVFLAASLRTRVSLSVAMRSLGGEAVEITPGTGSWGVTAEDGVPMLGEAAEHVKEAAGVLGRYVDGIGIRTFAGLKDLAEDRRERMLLGFGRFAGVPVLNLESALSHPLQALADSLTLRELLGETRGRPVALTWAYHPKALPLAVPLSFLHAAAVLGCEIRIARPPAFELPADLVAPLRTLAEGRGGGLRSFETMHEALRGATAVYAKSWSSPAFYGRGDSERAARDPHRGWQVTPEAMAGTADAWFLHCLPVRRNVVVADAVLDGPRSAVLQLAENRLHTARAVLAAVLGR
ncbi:MAG: N-acetylornithine carbamoyltransferase, partial [Planctomycetales bacterium]|nr:N-acetylornithine carbamoyltransferase [Planctomycetales bacterium]